MAQQIKKKFIQDGAVDGNKLRLLVDQSIVQQTDSGNIDLIKLDQGKVLLAGEEAALKSQLDAEASSRASADTTLQSNIDAEKARIDAILEASEADKDSFKEIVDLINSVDTENDTAFASYVTSNDAALAQEVSDRQLADTTLQSNIDAEASSRASADTTLQGNIDAEASSRASADTTLQSNIDSEAATRLAADDALGVRVDDEEAARLAGDSSLQSAIDTEKGRIDAILEASEADKDSFAEIVSLINSVDTENDTAFASYVTSNDAALAQEVSDRQSGDSALSDRLDVLEAQESEEVVSAATLGDFPATGEDSKIYVDKQQDRAYRWDSVDSEYKALDVRYGYRRFSVGITPTLHAQGYVEVLNPQGYMPNSVNVHVGRLAAYEIQDFLVSQEGSYVRITWRNSLASGGNEEVVPGDLVQISFPFAY